MLHFYLRPLSPPEKEQTYNDTVYIRFVDMSDRQEEKYEINFRHPRPLCNMFLFYLTGNILDFSLKGHTIQD